MSRYSNYTQYLGAIRCCNAGSIGPQGIRGPQGIQGPTGGGSQNLSQTLAIGNNAGSNGIDMNGNPITTSVGNLTLSSSNGYIILNNLPKSYTGPTGTIWQDVLAGNVLRVGPTDLFGVTPTTYGTNGSQGPTGTQGIEGFTGPTGTQGITGPTGSLGNTGPQGIPGLGGIVSNYGQFYWETPPGPIDYPPFPTPQYLGGYTTPVMLQWPSSYISSGISITNDLTRAPSRITVSSPGTYYFECRVQGATVSGSVEDTNPTISANSQIIFKKNGTLIPASQTVESVSGGNGVSNSPVFIASLLVNLAANEYVTIEMGGGYSASSSRAFFFQNIYNPPVSTNLIAPACLLKVFQLAYQGTTGSTGSAGISFTGPTGLQGHTGPTGLQGNTGPTGPVASVEAYTTLSTAKLGRSILPTSINTNLTTSPDSNCISIPDATVINIISTGDSRIDSESRFINNMFGGVNGRKVIFTLIISGINNGDVTFTQQFAKNRTGIFIGGTDGSVSIVSGGSICFVYLSDARLPDNQGYNNPGNGSGLWMYQYKNL